MTEQPKVTCLCLTRDRREWLPKAIECFLAQDYENRELMIVADGEDVSDLVPADPRIRLVALTEQIYTIGAKRNLGCMAALDADIIAHFDDDDFSAPARVTDQVTRLLESGKAVTGYHSMRFTDGVRSWRYEGTPLFGLGTSLAYRRDWWLAHPFEALQLGEDSQFVNEACWSHQMTAADAGELMHANIHPGNTEDYASRVGDNWILLP